MSAYIAITAGAAMAMSALLAFRLLRRPTVDDLVALVFWVAMMVWGLILL